MTAGSIRPLTLRKRILVSVGPGGVGKTTTAAAMAALAARDDRKTLVCTIDPAPRLADALGVGALGPEPRAIPPDAARRLGIDRDGLLWAARLDTQQSFNTLVSEQVADPEMRRRIFANTIYRQITTGLTGSQEYAATLALWNLHRRGDYDLIVLDTPPTANALDFLEAPGRIAQAVASPAISWFAPSNEPGFSFRRLRAGGAMVARRLAQLAGSQFFDDLTAFFVDFHLVLGGFLQRAQEIEALLRQPEVAFVLVVAPETAAIDEALFFAERLRDSGIPLGGFVANRVSQRPGLVDATGLARSLAALPTLATTPRAAIEKAAERMARTALDCERLYSSQRREIDRISQAISKVDVTEIPLLEHDVSTLEALRFIGDCL